MKEKDLIPWVSILNTECFGTGDDYSSEEGILRLLHLEDGELLVHYDDEKPIGYYLIADRVGHIEGIRMGVTREYRRKGIGTILVQMALDASKAHGKPFKTYTSKSNTESANLHLKSGMRLEFIDDWIRLIWNP